MTAHGLSWSLGIIPLLLTLLQSPSLHCFPNGAPSSACTSMTPNHGGSSRASADNPYELLLSASSTESDESIQVTLQGKEKGGVFRGFLIRALDDQEQAVGQFSNFGPNSQGLICGSNGINNAVTHNSKVDKANITFDWTAPKVASGEANKRVKFAYSMVQTFSSYWVNEIGSQELTVTATSKSPAPEEPAPEVEPEAEEKEADSEAAAEPLPAAYEGCGQEKGCFGMPAGCEASGDCQIMATYQKESGDTFKLGLHGLRLGSASYMALGISVDDKMGEDLVLACLGGSEMGLSWNKKGAKANVKDVTNVVITNENFETRDGLTSCTFSVPSQLKPTLPATEGQFEANLATSKYHLLLATGSVSNGKLTYHDQKLASGEPADLNSASLVGAATDILIRWHGICMVIAWLGCATSGMFIARYYKETWGRVQGCGKDVWFRCHQLFMTLTLGFTLAGVILVVSDRGLSSFSAEAVKANPHPVLGIVAIILALIQPVMALLRPSPQSERRWIFNWAHWFCGNAAWILALVAIFLAGTLAAAEFIPTSEYYWRLGIFVLAYILAHILMIVQRCWATNLASKAVEDISGGTPLSDYGSTARLENERPKKPDLRGSTLRILLLVLFLAFVWVFTIYLAVLLGLADQGREGWIGGHSHGGEADPESEE
eukprot:maker-scaffold523_size146679-snap-gene-0.15 protein:Tk01362 transcript:maker-scaffold523_size146679-snap-gene-0.15-mRNA-1 annotation:"ferric-chelate reductase 1 homolog"